MINQFPISGKSELQTKQIKKWTNRDRDIILTEVFNKEKLKLIAHASRWLNYNREDAKDAVQETFVKLLKVDKDKILNNKNLQGYIFVILKNTASELKRQKWHKMWHSPETVLSIILKRKYWHGGKQKRFLAGSIQNY